VVCKLGAGFAEAGSRALAGAGKQKGSHERPFLFISTALT
jgi:hypothetical protein